MTLPVLLLVFNRPDHTGQVVDRESGSPNDKLSVTALTKRVYFKN